jgi:hypothetical protein
MSWNALVDTLMWPRPVEIGDVLHQDTPQVRFAHDQDVIQTFATHTSEQAFADRIRTWSLHRRSKHLNSCSDCHSIKVCTVLGPKGAKNEKTAN